MAEQGLMTGTGVTTFSPDETTTRGMVATILYRLAGSPEEEDLSFADVAAGQWYSAGVSWAVVHGVMEGNGQTFGPEEVVTREQLVVLAYRYAQLQGYDVAAAENALADYPDGDTVSDWAAQAMAWAVENALITGTTATTLSPQNQASRAQVAAILMRFLQAQA